MTWHDDAGQWDHEDPPEPDYETWERDQLARDDIPFGDDETDHEPMTDEQALAILAEEGIDPDEAYGRLMAKVKRDDWSDDDDPGPDEESED